MKTRLLTKLLPVLLALLLCVGCRPQQPEPSLSESDSTTAAPIEPPAAAPNQSQTLNGISLSEYMYLP